MPSTAKNGRDNSIGTIIGTESSYSPSHYGEVLPFRLPNTGIIGSVCTKYFERADKTCAEDRRRNLSLRLFQIILIFVFRNKLRFAELELWNTCHKSDMMR